MGRKNDGGAAFPGIWVNASDAYDCAPDGQSVPPGESAYMRGMSLRDWFAGQALMGECASQDCDYAVDPVQAAAKAYQRADAMLAERGKTKK